MPDRVQGEAVAVLTAARPEILARWPTSAGRSGVPRRRSNAAGDEPTDDAALFDVLLAALARPARGQPARALPQDARAELVRYRRLALATGLGPSDVLAAIHGLCREAARALNAAIPAAAGRQRALTALDDAVDAMATAIVRDYEEEVSAQHAQLLAGRRQLDAILALSGDLFALRDREAALQRLADACLAVGFGAAMVNVQEEGVFRVRAVAGLTPREQARFLGNVTRREDWQSLLRPEFQIGGAYLVPAWFGRTHWSRDIRARVPHLPATTETGRWDPYNALFIPVRGHGETMLGIISVDEPADGRLPSSDTLAALQTLANQAAIALDNARLFAAEQEHAQALAEVGTMRDDFIAAVAHELRTPLTVVRGYAATLRAFGRTMAPERYESVVTRLDAAAERLTRLADDLVLVTAIERQGMEVQREAVELDAIARAVAEDLAGVYPSQRIVLRGRPDTLVWADRLRLHQVLANLIDNAARYSPPDAAVEVQWRQSAASVTLVVRDQGPGVPPEFRDRLFSRFATTGRALQGRRPGTGLGLYLAQELLGLMGGTITYRDAPGGGAIFQVRLPRADSGQ